MPRTRNDLERAQDELERSLSRGRGDRAMEDLARSQRALTESLSKSRRLRRARDPEESEYEDEIDDVSEDYRDDLDEEADEDQDPDDPDEGTGIDDLRGTVGRTKNHGRARMKRRPERDHDINESRRRLRRAESDDEDDEDDDDEEDMGESRGRRREMERGRRRPAARRLERARDDEDDDEDEDMEESRLRRGRSSGRRPRWAGDERETAGAERRRRRVGDDVYARGNGSYYTNEDADHEEDEEVPPDGPDVADGDDEDVFTIGAHRVHSERAMRRSRWGIPGREALYRSVARRPDLTEAIEAEPALEDLVDLLGDMQEVLQRSGSAVVATERRLEVLMRSAVALNRAVAQIARDVEAIKAQPVTATTPWGIPPQTNGRRRSPKEAVRLAKSKTDLLLGMEDLMRSGRIDAETYDQAGRLETADQIAELLTPDQRRLLGVDGVSR